MSYLLSAESERIINDAVAEMEWNRLQSLRAAITNPGSGYSFDDADVTRAHGLGVSL